MLSRPVRLATPLVVLAAVAAAGPAQARHSVAEGADRITRVAVNESLPGDKVIRGRVLLRTPRAGWPHRNRDTAPTAHFTVAPGSRCASLLRVAGRGVATRQGPLTQVRTATRGHAFVLGEAQRSRGAWRLGARCYENGRIGIYGIAAVRVAPRRWLHVRALGTLPAGCETVAAAGGELDTALRRMLRTARVQARVTNVPR